MDIPVGNEGSLSGMTPMNVLGPPDDGFQLVVPYSGLSVFNSDSVTHTYTFQKRKAGTAYPFWLETVLAGKSTPLMKAVTLDATDESLEVVMEADHTTTESSFDLSGVKCS